MLRLSDSGISNLSDSPHFDPIHWPAQGSAVDFCLPWLEGTFSSGIIVIVEQEHASCSSIRRGHVICYECRERGWRALGLRASQRARE